MIDTLISMLQFREVVRFLNGKLPETVLEELRGVLVAEPLVFHDILYGWVLLTVTGAEGRMVEAVGRTWRCLANQGDLVTPGFENVMIGVVRIDDDSGFRGLVSAEGTQRFMVSRCHELRRLDHDGAGHDLLLGNVDDELVQLLKAP